MHIDTDTYNATTLRTEISDAATIEPAINSSEPLIPLLPHITPLESLVTAPNIQFPLSSRRRTRPLSPLTRSRSAASTTAATTSLNLPPDGTQLTYAKAIRGNEEPQLRTAEEEEFARLFLYKTMKAIHSKDQPPDRRGGTSYYNPQIKEKYDSLGNKTFRVRGTIGGDTAAMPVAAPVSHQR